MPSTYHPENGIPKTAYDCVADVIKDYAEERVKSARDEEAIDCYKHIEQARAEALEEAAKVAETSHKNVDGIHMAFRIRNLKDGKGKK